ncbi:hypothetical protein K440DRAFT_632395 [Wilcoxina mikolae CBS 423.85]|nr:hypothetical protein K440DRAFT_632395 [Wilcoxina mikolae CBS 423.85]
MAVIPLPTPSFGTLSSNNTPPTLEKFGIIFGIFSGFISALAGVASWWLVTRSGVGIFHLLRCFPEHQKFKAKSTPVATCRI